MRQNQGDVLGKNGRLTIIMGLPGVGKTTFAKTLVAQLGGIRLGADEWMDALDINLWQSEMREKVEQLQWQLAQELLASGNHVVIEWGTWGRGERDTLRVRARELGATVVLYHLEAPVELLYQRISARGREDPPITQADLESWSTIIERPTVEELALFDTLDDAIL